MSDTQWPRFEVFQQDRDNRPHVNVGSVHAVDTEMALQNARDVFVRRPQTISLWVAPASEILMVSKEELEPVLQEVIGDPGAAKLEQAYAVFRKTTQRQSMTFVTYAGQVSAHSSRDALHRALKKFNDKETYIWWVCPEDAIAKSREEDIESLFEQAQEKHYRMPRHYRLMSEMMQLKRERE